MRFYQRILLVAALTLGMIAAGVAWERFYVSPLVEQAQRKPDPPDSATDDLPAECLEELSTMGSTSTALDPQPDRPLVAGKEALGESLPTAGDNVLRTGSGRTRSRCKSKSRIPRHPWRRRSAMRRRVRSSKRSRPNGTRRWLGRRPIRALGGGPGGALPVSAEETVRQNDLRDALEVRRRARPDAALRADDGEQRGEARRELVRRGFSEVDLELARQLFSPDAETRKQLARAVPRLSSVDAAQWLMWLALDPQPEVRLAAVCDAGDDRRSGLVGSCRGFGAQRPRSADSGLGRTDRQATRIGLQTRRLDERRPDHCGKVASRGDSAASPICSRYENISSASFSSTRLMAKPTWTMT